MHHVQMDVYWQLLPNEKIFVVSFTEEHWKFCNEDLYRVL